MQKNAYRSPSYLYILLGSIEIGEPSIGAYERRGGPIGKLKSTPLGRKWWALWVGVI